MITLNWLLHRLVGPDYETCWENCTATLGLCTDMLTPAGMIIVAENMFDGFWKANVPSRLIYEIMRIRQVQFSRLAWRFLNTAVSASAREDVLAAHRRARVISLAAAFVACLAAAPPPAAGEDNLVGNGGFEKGESGWMWQQWKGKPLPGFVDRDDMHEGLASFKFHQDGIDGELYMAREVKLPSRGDYVLSLALKSDRMPKGAARVRVMIHGQGWYGRETGRMDVVRTGGTHDWKTFTVRLPAAALDGAGKVTVFVYHDRPSQGTLGIDGVALKPAPAAGRSGASSSGARTASGQLSAVTYTADRPAVLATTTDARLAIRALPERALYRKGALPRVMVESEAEPGAILAYRVSDGFRRVLAQRTAPVGDGAELEVALPPGHGYYEVVATLRNGGRTLAEARRSIGALAPPAPPAGDEPFGLWIQGHRLYPELGVRWVRDGVYWASYRNGGERYLERRIELYEWFRKHGIRVIAYPKHPHPHQTSREVIADTPEAWRDLRRWWTTMVRRLAGNVDAWGVVNEPMRGYWKGSDRLILRYWALMREIVDRYDPGTPLIGPSLSPNEPSLVAQYRDLLDMGFGRHIDAVEMHTYITSPEDNDWIGNTRRLREMTRQATGRDLPIWSTEHGTGGGYRQELRQAQGLLRAWLVAKRIGYPVMIWHMFSHPQGNDTREVQFGIFRNTKRTGAAPPQPRPAGVAYGVMTRQLAGADYRTQLDHLGPSINAYVFERDGKAMAALWTTNPKSYEVTLPVGEERDVTATGLFGRVDPLDIRDGLVRVTVDRNPKIVAPLPRSLLERKPIARLEKPIATLAGRSVEASLTLVNPLAEPAKLRIEWLPADGWRLSSKGGSWSLDPRQRLRVPLTATARQSLATGDYQVHAKVFLDGKYVTSLSARATVLPRVTVGDIGPRFDGGKAMLAGTLRRLDPRVGAATIELDDGRSASQSVAFGDGDEARFALPVRNPPSDRLESLQVIVRDAENKVQLRKRLRMSFVPVARMTRAPVIDGDLGDWPEGGSGRPVNVRWGWDEGSLFLAVRVADHKHVQGRPVTEMWKEDSLQIGMAPGRPGQLVRAPLPGMQEADMVEFDVALSGGRPAMYRHRTVNRHVAPTDVVSQKQVRHAVRHGQGVTTYELRIPVAELGLKPLRGGQVLRAGLLINDNDGRRRRTTEWFGGIREGKDPELFGHLYLRE